jgi:hypothetical protein
MITVGALLPRGDQKKSARAELFRPNLVSIGLRHVIVAGFPSLTPRARSTSSGAE